MNWECSCLQKKCGACAMLINNTPALACDTKLHNDARKVIELA
ncbi:MAG: fumarate reductase iron-sulfur subunit, partial [Spirochaetaceae bacterium]|nr:fumarate reductase iron-sulfur subunit [Spirochaetaceae bacterium]